MGDFKRTYQYNFSPHFHLTPPHIFKTFQLTLTLEAKQNLKLEQARTLFFRQSTMIENFFIRKIRLNRKQHSLMHAILIPKTCIYKYICTYMRV